MKQNKTKEVRTNGQVKDKLKKEYNERGKGQWTGKSSNPEEEVRVVEVIK